jgi:23S rRNA (uracil1939-C5)-methyltransferase
MNTTKYKTFSNVSITGMHSAGRAIGTIGNKKIFVDYAVPGDVADLKAAKRQKGFVVATIDKLVIPSPHRANPFCKHFGTCGGCNWMHIEYKEQLNLKRQILLDALKKYEINIPGIPEIHASPQLKYFRNRTEFAFSAGNNALGFHPAGKTDEVFDVEECFIQPEPCMKIKSLVKKSALEKNIPFYHIKEKTGILRKLIIRTSTTGDVMVILGIIGKISEAVKDLLQEVSATIPEISSIFYIEMENGDQNSSVLPVQLFSGSKTFYEEKAAEIKFHISPQTFYQPNPLQAVRFFEKIKEFSDLKGSERIFDLYCGAGTISLFIADKAGKIIGIEGSSDAVSDAKQNALLNGIDNIDFIQGDILKTFTSDFLKLYEKPNVIILDPPRSGTLIEIKKTMMAAEPEKIIYVSCNPVSLAWDLKQLSEKYRITALELFDQHPQTHHVETVVLLEKNK